MEQIKKLRLNKKTILIIAFVGILLMLIGGGNTDKNNSESLSDEARLEQILSEIDGVGEVRVMLSYRQEEQSSFTDKQEGARYIGAVVLAEGGGKSSVKEKIIKAVNAVTGLDAHKIVVYKLGGS